MIGASDATQHPSQNYGPRRKSARPELLVLHYTAMTGAIGARDWLCNPESQVSAHYVLAENGKLWQLVCETQRAWHAGAGAWGDTCDVNSHSIGIEISNTGSQPFSEPQMAALERLMTGIMSRWDLPAERVIGHSDCALGRKIDPGARFDWKRLAMQGLSVWPKAAAAGDFAKDCARFGYVADTGQQDLLLAAFRMRFRPWAIGPLDDTDRALAADLAARWPAQPFNPLTS
ncbi:N-acetylmuramoyl-L-alanine amidase [Pelagimonas varians]|uniref:N-acetylmuramoyl-L-alanine amidase n=1 Tax=Pelagimonas varians TaxID=696760 RepID=A0A238KD43_9RHOB|nr:N-acetylmuramoyl-L-alanine amidase [Pelagimonas varians]PYG30052.1 N-acetylmuramoyl-L-alanine amidase [Pelagimonas varians]SMX40324.1 N-acetylmuramoyl-L-alanine amidase AmiD precursor [Pelagimonas varians]